MTVMVGWQCGPDDDEDVARPAAADLPRPDPEDLHDPADVPPADLLAAADPATLPGQWVDAGMSAWFAHANRASHEQARWMLETSRARAGTTERVLDRPRAAKIIAASLGWSEAYAAQRLEFARQVLERLPALGDAMADGRLEEQKAGFFTTMLADLDTEQAREVVDRVLPAAPELAFRALRHRIEANAEAVDPRWAAARRAAAIARRRVSFGIAPSGAAELCGLDLPEEPAQDAHDRIVALGRMVARRLRRAGLDAPVGPIESEVMLTLTGPEGAGMWDGDVVEHVVTCFGGPAGDGSDPEDGAPDDGGPADDGSAPDHDEPDDGGPCDDHGPHGSGDCAEDSAAHEADAEWRVVFPARVALRLGLGTVLGLDRRPGEIPGRGPVVSQVAVCMAWRRTLSTWRLVLYDRRGALEYVLTTRPPRTGRPPAHAVQRRHQVIEVTAYTDELDALHLALGAEQPALDLPAGTGLHDALVPGDALGLLTRAARALAAARERPTDEHPAHTRAEAHRRFPGAALRAWVQARDRTCRAIGCDADAVGCDIDHTVPVTEGGRTEAGGLGACCRRDHLFKHDPATGWSVAQPRPGHFEWTAPTGRVHVVAAEPYDPLPDPVPRTSSATSRLPGVPPGAPRPAGPPGQPRRNRHGHLTDAARATADRVRARADTRGGPGPGERTGQPHYPLDEHPPDDRWPDEPPF
jgi:hypothetical protein